MRGVLEEDAVLLLGRELLHVCARDRQETTVWQRDSKAVHVETGKGSTVDEHTEAEGRKREQVTTVYVGN